MTPIEPMQSAPDATSTPASGVQPHGTGAERTPAGSSAYPSMLPRLDALRSDPDQLRALAREMTEDPRAPADNPNIPAGYTYFGQLIAHDVTYDITQPQDGTAPARNRRTPQLDLDWLYGDGPGVDFQLYQRSNPALLRVGVTRDAEDENGQLIGALPNDLPRDAQGVAQIHDIRNDVHLIISQFHLAFIKAHNRLVTAHGMSFEHARSCLTLQYQRLILEDYLPRLLNADTLRAARERPQFQFAGEPRIPAEFACAGFRLHSMIRSSYDYNRFFGAGGMRRSASLDQLLGFSGFSHGGMTVPITTSWVIDWNRFFEIPNSNRRPQRSRLIDGSIAAPLNSPDETRVLLAGGMAERTLLRGSKMGLPSGQDAARALGCEVLDPAEIARRGRDGERAASSGLHEQSPLWYYILKEAEIQEGGQRLGQLGSRIVAEVILALLRHDACPHLDAEYRVEDGPLNARTVGEFLAFVDDVDPLEAALRARAVPGGNHS